MSRATKGPAAPPALQTWLSLNEAITSADEDACRKLIEWEKANRRRRLFLLRIHARFNKMRAERERRELLANAT